MKFKKVEPKPYIKLRVIATLIDYSIYFLCCSVYIYIFDENPEAGLASVYGANTLPLIILWILYFPGTEAMNQATPGHDLCKLIVVGSKGEKPSFSTLFKRRICDIIDFGLYGIPALICVAKTEKHQRIGDLWANTLVVRKADIIETEVSF